MLYRMAQDGEEMFCGNHGCPAWLIEIEVPRER